MGAVSARSGDRALSISFVPGAPVRTARRAAPAGGPIWGRGCAIFLASILVCTGPVVADPTVLPSGFHVEHFDTIREEGDQGVVMRVRFVAQGLGGDGADYASLAPDMEHLCQVFAPRLAAETGEIPRRIVVSLMSEPTEFGIANPQVTQYFESYLVENGLCIWEAF